MVRKFLLVFCFLLFGCLYDSPNFQESDYLPLNDSDYPYSSLPRLVIETKDFKEVRDRENYKQAFLQIYEEKNPLSEIYDLEIRGRGHSSFTDFLKFGYRLKFKEKVSLFGMPENKDWVLLPNFADKTLIKNKLTFDLAKNLNAPYAPRSEFVELYVNREYLGVYQLTEKIEVAKNKVNIPKKENSFLVEMDHKYSSQDEVIFSSHFNLPLHIHSPDTPSDSSKRILKTFIDSFENYLSSEKEFSMSELEKWIDLESYIRYYWIQEFSKNVDGAFGSSVYFTWFEGSQLNMGPVWDFDIAYGGAHEVNPKGWYVRNHAWNSLLFSDKNFNIKVKEYWKNHKDEFIAMIDSVDVWSKNLEHAANNNFKRWPVLESTESWAHNESVSSYKEANEILKAWLKTRYLWIEENL